MTKRLQFMQPRLPAQHSRLKSAVVFSMLIRPALRKMFDQVLLHVAWGDAEGPDLRAATPVLCFATHPSWWDGYLAALVFREHFPRKIFLMMEEAQLKRYFFFRWLGCFSVDRHDPREALRSMRYAADRLSQERKPLLWIFPQGEIQPTHRRPLVLYSGAAEIAIRSGGVWAIPTALQYEFSVQQRPLALISFGTPMWVDDSCDRATLQAQFTQALTTTADQLKMLWDTQSLDQFQVLLQGKQSINVLFDTFLGPLVKRLFKQ